MKGSRTRQIAFAAMFAALAVILSVSPFTFYLTQSIRITFREVPIYLCSTALGPVFGGMCSFIADLCGTFVSNSGNAWNPLFALNAVLIGVLPGLIYRLCSSRLNHIVSTVLSITLTNLSVNVFLTPVWLCILGFNGGLSYWPLLLSRLPLIAGMTVIHILAVLFLTPVVRRFTEGKIVQNNLEIQEQRHPMTYDEAIDYIHGLYWRGSKLGLVRTIELCHLLGDPQKNLKFIHVAGTNGKGSTCAMLSRVLTSAGYKTGLFVSPFVDRFNERIQLNNTPIPDDELAALVSEIAPVVESMPEPATEFEIIAALGFLYYARQKCDYVVLEVGLGGELDATNVIDTPLLAVITAIDYDHMHILGDTIEEIAKAKAGIIKDGGAVLFYGEHKDALPVIEAACAAHGATLHVVDRSTLFEGAYDLHGQTFDYRGYHDLRLGLLGRYQMKNAATVIDAVELLREQGVAIPDEALYRGLRETTWPARFELLREDPPFFVDGGHNPHGVNGTVDTFRRLFPEKKATIIMGMMRDKDVSQSVELLLPIAARFYTVTPDNARSMPAEELAELIRSCGGEATAFDSVDEAVSLAAQNGLTLAVGSLYMAGEIHAAFQRYAAEHGEGESHEAFGA